MTEEINTISKDMLVSDIFNVIYDSPMPLAVVENDRLLGVVIRGRVIEALAGTTDFSEEEEVLNA
jgi:glycine betaine/proline transport system ATP-binding protein